MNNKIVSRDNTSRTASLADLMFLCVLFFALIFPSSLNGEVGVASHFQFLVNTTLLCFYFKYCRLNINYIAISLLLLSLYVFYTIISGYAELAIGHAYFLLPMLFFITLRVKRFPEPHAVLFVYYSLSIFVFIFAYAPYFSPSLSDSLLSYYSGGYEGLTSIFIDKKVPISIFVSHSYAAFFYFLMLFISWFLFCSKKNMLLNALIIGGCFTSLVLLSSGSSYFFLIYSFLYIIASLFFHKSGSIGGSLLKYYISIMAIIFAVFLFGYENLFILIERIIGSEGNGLLARYVGGVLEANFEYISNNPIKGIGFSYSDRFYYTDSDYIVMALRIGVVGALLYFGAILYFLYVTLRNVCGFFSLWVFIIAIFVFMVSMPISTYGRTIPFMVLIFMILGSCNISVTKNRVID